MNILLICNNKNLLGNKLVIYSTLYCNSEVDWFICLTEEIGEKEEQNIQNLVSYLDYSSSVIFEQINEEQSLEEQFKYLTDFWYIAPDCIVTQTIEEYYNQMQEKESFVIPSDNLDRFCTFYINLEINRKNNISTFIDYGDNGIENILPIDNDLLVFDTRIGCSGTFSFNFNMPIIFWFKENNQKIYNIPLETWYQLYPDFEPMIKQIKLAETIHF